MQIVVNSTHEELEHPGRVIVDYKFCMEWFEWAMQGDHYQLEPDTLALATIVFPDANIKEDNWEGLGNGIVSLIARIDFTLKSQKIGEVPLVWRQPESGIYPGSAVHIPDLMLEMGFFGKHPSRPIEENK